MTEEIILIIDFGSQYTHLIARKVRESNTYCKVFSSYGINIETIKEINPKGIILSGSPSSVYEENAPKIDRKIFFLGIPILGVCYGMQLMTNLLGGKVSRSEKREYGYARLMIKDHSNLFANIRSTIDVWMSHSDYVMKQPDGFETMAYTENTPIAAFLNRRYKLFGLQFHPEVIHTQYGKEIIKNFIFKICLCTGTYTAGTIIERTIKNIKDVVKEENVLCGLSGGVDSTVTAVLIHKAIANKLTCFFIDTGLLRKNEVESVINTFHSVFKINLIHIDAKKLFLNALNGISDPEEKRKIIGNEFIKIFEKEAIKFGNFKFLAQGTLYPDVIESTSTKGPSAKIKSHHNVGGLPSSMPFKLIEPLKELFKDEVRKIGEMLGVPKEIITKHPFPGPGLAVRIIGEITEEKIKMLQEADFIVEEEIRKIGLYERVWQSFAILLPVKTVGIMGDERTYENVVAIRIVESQDGMTADWIRVPYDLLAKISNRIVNEVKGVNRVVYDITSKPPGTIEWE